ncbi:MAG: response regulator [Magnetococcales bacterium]|nr:response regulator [Magnetococcales bacterium]
MNTPNKKMILLVDDTPDNIDVLSGILNDTYKIKVALNGKRALTIAGSQPQPDLILLDVMMPDMDGFEVCRRLKSEPKTSDIPVIFVTAKTEIGDEKTGFELGAADYITKPVKPEIVRARVATQMRLFEALRRAEHLSGENREMLNKTLVGSMRVVSDLLSWASPAAYLRAARLRAFMEGMVSELAIKGGWQLNLAATLSQIGLVALPALEMHRYATGQGVSLQFINLFKRHAEIGGRALEQVPRMQAVARIIEHQHTPLPATGAYPEATDKRGVYLLGRQILRLLVDFDHGLLGAKSKTVLKRMEKDPQYDTQLVEALQRVINKMAWIPCALPTHKLMPGMVLDEPVTFPNSREKMAKETVLAQDTVGLLVEMFDESRYRLFRVRVPFKVDKDGNLPSMKEMLPPTPATTTQCEPTPAAPKRQFDPTVVEPLLQKLHALLLEDDPAAKEVASELQQAVAATDIEALAQRIGEMVSVYEFPEALGLAIELAETTKCSLT